MLYKKTTLIMIALSTSFYFTNANAATGVCDPQVGSDLATSAVTKIANDNARIQKLSDQNQAALNAATDSYSCSDIWEGANVSVSFQKVQDLIKKAGQAIVSKACSAAQEKISEATSKLSSSASLDTSSIQGLSDLGMGNLATVSSSSGTTGVTVNGQSTNMANLLK